VLSTGTVSLFGSLLRGLYVVDGPAGVFLGELCQALPALPREREGILARFPAAVMPSTAVLLPRRIRLKNLEN
jgi:hypothetical protein